jgi:hypothetical protein
MEVPRHAELFEIASGLLLTTEYQPAEVGSGRLTIRATDPQTGDWREGKVSLDPGHSGGYRVEEWSEGGALLLIGGDSLVVVDAATIRLQAALPWEYKECHFVGLPWLIEGKAMLFVVSETRVFCLDRRLAIRWCWTVRNESTEWVQIASLPVVEGDTLHVPLRTMAREWTLRLRIDDAVHLP